MDIVEDLDNIQKKLDEAERRLNELRGRERTDQSQVDELRRQVEGDDSSISFF